MLQTGSTTKLTCCWQSYPKILKSDKDHIKFYIYYQNFCHYIYPCKTHFITQLRPSPSPIEKWNKLGLCTFSKRCLKVVGFTGRGLRSFEITVVKGHRTIRVRTGSQPFENLTQAPVVPSSGRGVH